MKTAEQQAAKPPFSSRSRVPETVPETEAEVQYVSSYRPAVALAHQTAEVMVEKTMELAARACSGMADYATRRPVQLQQGLQQRWHGPSVHELMSMASWASSRVLLRRLQARWHTARRKPDCSSSGVGVRLQRTGDSTVAAGGCKRSCAINSNGNHK